MLHSCHFRIIGFGFFFYGNEPDILWKTKATPKPSAVMESFNRPLFHCGRPQKQSFSSTSTGLKQNEIESVGYHIEICPIIDRDKRQRIGGISDESIYQLEW